MSCVSTKTDLRSKLRWRKGGTHEWAGAHHEATRCRVLHVIVGHDWRGAEVFATQLAQNMERAGRLRNIICCLHSGGEGGPTRNLHRINLPLIEVSSHESCSESRRRLDPWRVLRLRRVMRRVAPQIVVAHGSETLKYTVMAQALHTRFPIVYRNVGAASYWAKSRSQIVFNRLLLKRVAAVVSVSEHARSDFIQHYGFPQERVFYIPNAVDAADFDKATLSAARSAVRRTLGLQEKDIGLVNVGSLSQEKSQVDLLRLTVDLRVSGLPVSLLIVGDGPLRGELQMLAHQSAIAERVHFLGSRTDVARVLSAADLFVLPSKSEGMPGALIEAGLAGLASVAYGVGGVPEVIEQGRTGMVVAPGNYSELVRVVAQLISDKDQRSLLGQRARQFCLEHFDIQKVALAYEELLVQILGDMGGLQNGAA